MASRFRVFRVPDASLPTPPPESGGKWKSFNVGFAECVGGLSEDQALTFYNACSQNLSPWLVIPKVHLRLLLSSSPQSRCQLWVFVPPPSANSYSGHARQAASCQKQHASSGGFSVLVLVNLWGNKQKLASSIRLVLGHYR